jgi:hypothetical protein
MKLSRKQRFIQLINYVPSSDNIDHFKAVSVIEEPEHPQQGLINKLLEIQNKLDEIVNREIRFLSEDLMRQDMIMEISTIARNVKNVINKKR